MEQMIQEEERLLMEQSELRVDVIDLTRLAQIKVCLNCLIDCLYTAVSQKVHLCSSDELFGWLSMKNNKASGILHLLL